MEITRQDYHADTSRISKSGLDHINKSPLHYWDKYLNPDHPERKSAKHFRVGDVSNDLLLLAPDQFKTLYAIVPVGAPKKPTEAQRNARRPSPDTLHSINWWNQFSGENPDKTIVMPDEWETAQFIRDAVLKHPPAARLLREGFAERTMFFTEPITGAKCKFRPDWIATDVRFLVDLKTTLDASPAAFGRAALNYRYHVQGAFYYDGFTIATGDQYDGFAFIAAEKTRPFPVKVYYMDDDDFLLGRRAYMENLETYVECLKNNKWPAYGNAVERIRIPQFALNKL